MSSTPETYCQYPQVPWPGSARLIILVLVGIVGCQKKAKEVTDLQDAYKVVPYLDKLSQIQSKEQMPETEVERIMAGFPSSVEEIKGDYAVAAATFKGKAAFIKLYDCKLPDSERHVHIHVYFDKDHRVVGTTTRMVTD